VLLDAVEDDLCRNEAHLVPLHETIRAVVRVAFEGHLHRLRGAVGVPVPPQFPDGFEHTVLPNEVSDLVVVGGEVVEEVHFTFLLELLELHLILRCLHILIL